MAKSEPTRLHHLDAIRVSAILLLIPYHGARFLQKGKTDTRLVDGWIWFLQSWHLPLFFAISGFLAASAMSRSTPRGQVKARLKRLGVPLAVGMVTIVPLANIVVAVSAKLKSNGQPDPRTFALGDIFEWHPRHLWFIDYLLVLSLIAIVVWMAAKRAPDFTGRIADRLGWIISSPLSAFPLALVGAAVLMTKDGWETGGQQAGSLIPGPSTLVYFGIFFGAGWLLSRREAFLAQLQKGWWFRLGLAAIVAVPFFALFYDSSLFTGSTGFNGSLVDEPNLRFLGLFCFGLLGWSVVLGIWGFLASRIHAPSPALRYLSDASFWIYLIHIPFLVASENAFAATGWPAEIRYPLTIIVTLALSVASYAVFVRHTPIGTFLHGKRPRQPKTKVTGPAPAAAA